MKVKNLSAKKILFILLVSTLLFGSVFNFCACKRYKEPVRTGIVIEKEEKVEYSLTTKSFATLTFKNFFSKILDKAFSGNVPSAMATKWEDIAIDVQDIVEDVGVSEDSYLTILELINENEESYASAMVGLVGDNFVNDAKKLKSFYSAITATFGSDKTAIILFNVANYYFDYKYQAYMADYEDRGWQHLLVSAQEMADNKRILQEEIKIENFIPFSEMICFISELFYGGAFDNSFLASFTNQEILQFLKYPDFSGINITKDGWELSLSLLKPFFSTSIIRKKVFANMQENGDLALLSVKMPNVVAFITSVQESLTLEDVENLRNGNKNDYLASVFANLDDTQWALLSGTFDFELKNDEYNIVAKNEYGNSYTDYLNSLDSYTFDEVRQAVSNDNFFAILTSYLKGLCPAFFYEV